MTVNLQCFVLFYYKADGRIHRTNNNKLDVSIISTDDSTIFNVIPVIHHQPQINVCDISPE